jgi:4-diphosphocytidyl-2-C-methyl-D-erythritol kinase
MVSFPNCKINIGLQVMGKRADGYHDLETIFYPIAIKDVLEIIDAPQKEDVSFSVSGLSIEGNVEDNLCVKAYRLLKKDFPQLPGINMHLHKMIPMGAGVGGGSADAAFTLQLLNKKYSLGIDLPGLNKYALVLGSDCPFFIINKPCFASGRGEILEEVSLDLSAYKIVLINPGIHINTGWAFSMLERSTFHENIKNLIKKPIIQWADHIGNDFETPVFKAHPEIRSIKEKLYDSGALYASMSGSGSSLYGIFEKNAVVDLNFQPHYFYKWV